MEYVQQRNIEKVSRFLDKGLDPNFHDPDTGGEKACAMSLIPFLLKLVCVELSLYLSSPFLYLPFCLCHK